MATIDFGNFPASFAGVDMSKPAALGQAILRPQDFGSFDFASGYRDLNLVEILSTSSSSYVLAHGSFAFNGSTPDPASSVFAIEIWTPQGYRLILDGISVSWQTLQNALTARNPASLWAGLPLEILGHATLGDTLVGGTLSDEIYGFGGQDVLTGNAGNDYLDGGASKDTMRGGLGNDDYFVSHERDVIVESGGQGIDLVVTTLDGYRLPTHFEDLGLFSSAGAIDGFGNAVDNFISGNNSANRLQGLGGDDTIVGLSGADLLSGGEGNDDLDGDAGVDQLRGGNGNDFLYWDSADTQVYGNAGLDTVIVASGSLDLRGVPDGKLLDVERFSLAGGAGQVLTLASADVLELSSTTDTLRVLGGASDRVDVIGNFTELGTSGGFTTYKLGGGAKLIVESHVDVA